MELGGNAPFLVFDDADIDAAIGRDHLQVPQLRPDLRLHQPLLRAGRRLRRVLAKLAARGKGLEVGYGTRRAHIGPLIDVGAGEGRGAPRERARRRRPAGDRRPRTDLGGSFFDRPCSPVKPEMLLAQEETFGPLAA